MMEALGFDVKSVCLIMLCVTSGSYNIQINGGRVTLTHGLRQGDPLSLYLFIICAAGFSLLLQQAQVQGNIHGCRVARNAPAISHLFFANDSLLFLKPICKKQSDKRVLANYEGL